MKSILAFFFAACASVAVSQVALNATAFLSDEAGNASGGVPVAFSVQAAGAVFTANATTDEAGEATVALELPTGTMQGMLNATYMNCDSVEVTMTGSFSANALGGLSDVYLTGIYCGVGTGGEGCDMSLDGGLTVLGSWMFMVSGAPEDAVYDWSIDGATMSNTNSPEFGWQFDGESVWTVCVYVTSDSCEPWTDCYVVDTTDPTGGGECELSFEVVQSYDEAGNPIAGSLDVIVPELAGQPTYFWDFGDEGTSTDASPSHTYAGNGPYLLCLTATWGENTICTATYCDSVSVDEDGMINFADGFTIHVNPTGNTNAVENAPTTMETPVFPNPVSEGEAIRWTAVCGAGEQLDVFTHTGQLVEEIPAARTSVLSTANWEPGVYVLRWTCPSGAIRTSRLIVQ
jgi:hypothetical protein